MASSIDQVVGALRELFVVVSIVVLIDVRCRSGVSNQLSSLDGIEHLTNLTDLDVSCLLLCRLSL